MWDKPLIFKELTEVYIVNHRRFFTKKEAEAYVIELEMKEIERGFGDAQQSREI